MHNDPLVGLGVFMAMKDANLLATIALETPTQQKSYPHMFPYLTIFGKEVSKEEQIYWVATPNCGIKV